jgi:hypothetical protein
METMTMWRSVRVLAVLSLATAALSGCADLVFHPAGGRPAQPKPENCELRTVGSHPGPDYVEIGVISIEGDRSFGAGSYQDPQEFVNRVRPQVCRAGGEVVATEVNGRGIVVRGVVFRRARVAVERGPAAPPPAPKEGCEPICSPGFACEGHTCVPQCNPVCANNQVCGDDRLCHPSGM